MFYSQFILAKKGPLGTIWIAAHLERKLRKNQVADTDISDSVDSILSPDVPIALRLSSHLLLGVVRIYSRKVTYLFDDCSEALLKIKQAFRSTAVDLPPEESTAPYHSITLPETFELDDFELPDSDIFQGNYVDHHVSTREQITLQDTMDGVVYSTSQFGLDERFGDGDTSHVALDLEEDLLLEKTVSSGLNKVSEVEEMAYQDRDARDDMMTGPSEMMPMTVDDPRNKIEGINEYSEFNDYAEAEAPSTPGLLEEPNLSNKGLITDDHLESEDNNLAEAIQNGLAEGGNCKDTLVDLPDALDIVIAEAQPLQEKVDGETLNSHVENELIVSTSVGELRACDSHGTDNVMPLPDEQSEDVLPQPLGACRKEEVISVSGTAVDIQGKDSNATAVIQLEENQISIANQDTEIQADSDKLGNRPDNVISNDDQNEDLTSSVTYDLPAPETLLSVPQSLHDEPEGLLVESTPDKVAEGGVGSDIDTQTAGKKRNFTESSITVQSVNSVESFGATRSKRTADSIPDDDDLLSSILVGRSSAFKMKSTTPAPQLASKKRARSSTRPSALKRKVLMDDSMVLLGDTIRQQLINTEDIRRLRKKAPCTRTEILLIQRQFLEEEIFTEPVLTGTPAELTWLHGQTFDLSGITLYQNGDDNSSGVAKDSHAECPAWLSDTLDNEAAVTNHETCSDNIDGKPGELPFQADKQPGENNYQQEENDHQIASASLNNLEGHETAVADGGECGVSENKDFEAITESDINGTTNIESLQTQLRIEDEVLFDDGKQMDASVDIRSDMINGGLDTEILTAPETDGCINCTSISNHQAPEDNENDKIGMGYEGVLPLDSEHLGNEEFKMDSMYFGTNRDFRESATDMEIGNDHFVMHDDLPEAVFGNDTEFLNVDDEDVDEEDDDNGMPRTEDPRLLDNRGWSSRTRAVAKYLQTVFDEEYGHGRNILSVDNLLNGKTRKEASRMFFETLVLKTRDYIQVEQANPFDSIIIKPQAKLMKSDF